MGHVALCLDPATPEYPVSSALSFVLAGGAAKTCEVRERRRPGWPLQVLLVVS